MIDGKKIVVDFSHGVYVTHRVTGVTLKISANALSEAEKIENFQWDYNVYLCAKCYCRVASEKIGEIFYCHDCGHEKQAGQDLRGKLNRIIGDLAKKYLLPDV
jgi:hypothetical protein